MEGHHTKTRRDLAEVEQDEARDAVGDEADHGGAEADPCEHRLAGDVRAVAHVAREVAAGKHASDDGSQTSEIEDPNACNFF